jgi:hypothetical protein
MSLFDAGGKSIPIGRHPLQMHPTRIGDLQQPDLFGQSGPLPFQPAHLAIVVQRSGGPDNRDQQQTACQPSAMFRSQFTPSTIN